MSTPRAGQRTCNNCGYSGPDLIRVLDNATRKSMCNKCVCVDASHVAEVAEKIARHQAEGRLDQYPLKQRLADLKGEM